MVSWALSGKLKIGAGVKFLDDAEEIVPAACIQDRQSGHEVHKGYLPSQKQQESFPEAQSPGSFLAE